MSANENLPPLPAGEQVLPCPHCGGFNVAFLNPDGPEGDRGYDSVICGDCGATCNEMDTRPELDCVTAWNRRSSPWLPIDSAPKGQSLLLWTDHGPALGWWSVFDNQWTAGLWTALFPTHYMLIPPMLESKP